MLPVAGIAVGKALVGKAVAGAAASAANCAMSALFNAAKNGRSISSLADFARPFRVEPITLVDRGLQKQPFTEDIMKMALTQFTAYYLQAFNAVINIKSIKTLQTFDSLNPNRSIGMDSSALFSSNEGFGLPSLEDFETKAEPGLIGELTYSTEADDEGKPLKASARVEKFYEIENLAVGKMINVEFNEDGKDAKIPVLLRLLPTALESDILTHIFTMGGRESWGERLQLARAGLIRPIRDLIFGIDILDAHLRTLMMDKSGTYKNIVARRRNNVGKASWTGVVSVADASNIAIITAETARNAAKKLHGNLDNMGIRERIFDNSYLLLLIIVDERREMVTVYHRGLDVPHEMTFREIKASEKGKGADIGELFKMFHSAMGGGANI